MNYSRPVRHNLLTSKMNNLVANAIRMAVALAGFHVLTLGFQGMGYSYGQSASAAVATVLTAFFIYYYQIYNSGKSQPNSH